jgi:multidrug resistance efflux pump
MKKTVYKLMVLVVILALGLTACASNNSETADTATPEPSNVSSDGVIAEGNIVPAQGANLSFLAVGMVEDVNVKIGDKVSKGDVLARLANASQAEAQLAAANLELVDAQQAMDALVRTGDENLALAWIAFMDAQVVRAEAERDWEELNVDDIEDRIEDAKAEVEELQSDLDDAQDEFDKYKDLDEDNDKRKTAEDDLETAQEDYNEAVRNLEEITQERDTVRAALDAAIASEAEARHQYELSADGANADQLALAQSRLDNAKAQVAAAESALGNYVLTAPFDGVVADVAVKVGEQVAPESRAVSIGNDSEWVVETSDTTELEIVNIQVGQKVTLTPDALPDVTMDGVVTSISQSSFTDGGDVMYTVYISVDTVDSRVKWGMTVQATFEPME